MDYIATHVVIPSTNYTEITCLGPNKCALNSRPVLISSGLNKGFLT